VVGTVEGEGERLSSVFLLVQSGQEAWGVTMARFDVGGRSVEDLASERASEDREEGVEGLLRRMWLAPGAREEELGE